jgi:hypothetical protein
MGVGGQSHAPAALPPEKDPGTHCIGGWVGPRVGLDEWGNSSPPLGFDPRTVQPVASRNTDCAMPSQITYNYVKLQTQRTSRLGTYSKRCKATEAEQVVESS